MTKIFDWVQFSDRHKPEWSAWLKTNHGRPVTEAEYMQAYRAQRDTDTRPHKANRYSTAKLRAVFRNLRKDFGFFA